MRHSSSNRRRQKLARKNRGLKMEGLESRMLMASFRSVNGTGNNPVPQNSQFGAAETQVIRVTYPAVYPDGFGDVIVNAQDPNARTISNSIMAQSGSVFDKRNLSDWVVQWGQFLTHDMDLTGTSSANNVLSTGATGTFSIPITDANDPLGPNPIPFNRSDFDPTTGTNALIGVGPQARRNWREQINEVTSFIDASNVYGSDATRAANLRTFVDGKLKTTAGGLLPGLNDAGEENDNIGLPATSLFLAGDVRANEQVGLTATHALFVREHNRLADLIKAQNPSMNDETIYQWARKIVGAEMQIITYEEFLPAMIGNTGPNPAAYVYNQNINPSITNSFAAAFFRHGHSMQSSDMELVNNDGSSAGSLLLKDIFFKPSILQNNPGVVDQALKGLASQVAQANDALLVDGLRNFLFGPPGAGGLDLGALDIQRGRDHGLQSFNDSRDAYGLTRLTSFAQLTSDTMLQSKLQTLYGNINNVEAFVGVLVENHLAGQSAGPMLNRSLVEQFTRLRDGDRFFYTGDVDLDNPIVTSVIDLDNLELADIIRANTGITNIQDNVFFVPPSFTVTESASETNLVGTGTTDTVTVQLNSAPTSNVVVSISSESAAEASVSVATLTFTTTNWSVPQTVTVTGGATTPSDGSTILTFAINDALSADPFDPLANQTVTVHRFDLGDAPSTYPT